MRLVDILKEGASWKDIYATNKKVIGSNPNLIKPGQQLTMPDGTTYTVKAGDTLGKIAANFKPSASPVAPQQSGQAAEKPAEQPAPAAQTPAPAEQPAPAAQTPAPAPAPVQVAQSTTDPKTSTGFDWARLMKNAGIDPTTNKQSTELVPQTGGEFTTSSNVDVNTPVQAAPAQSPSAQQAAPAQSPLAQQAAPAQSGQAAPTATTPTDTNKPISLSRPRK